MRWSHGLMGGYVALLGGVLACGDDATACGADGIGCVCTDDGACAAGLHCYQGKCLPAEGTGGPDGTTADTPTGAGTASAPPTSGTEPTSEPTVTATSTSTSDASTSDDGTTGEATSTGGAEPMTVCRELDQPVLAGAFAGFEDTIELAADAAVGTVRVEVVVRTADAADVDLSIAGAQRITRLYGGGHCSEGVDVVATFAADAGQTIEETCPDGQGVSGTVLPDGDLSVFTGRGVGGPWTLRIRDMAPANNEVVLERWCLHVDPMAGPIDVDPKTGDAIWLRAKALGDAGRRAFAMWAYDESRDVVVGLGGCEYLPSWHCTDAQEGALTAEFELDGLTWTELDAPGPGGITKSPNMGAMIYDPTALHVLLFGGFANSGVYDTTAETWTYDGAAWTKLAPATSPGARVGHTLVWDPEHAQALLFGGYNPQDELVSADVWAWDGTTWTELPGVGGPGPRYHHAATWHPTLARMMVLGGFSAPNWDSDSAHRDLWAYDPASGEWQQYEDAPVEFAGAQIGHDGVRDRLVAFEDTTDVVFEPTYEWDGAVWRTIEHPIYPPVGRRGHGMLWIEPLGVLFMYGGTVGIVAEDTWFLTRVP